MLKEKHKKNRKKESSHRRHKHKVTAHTGFECWHKQWNYTCILHVCVHVHARNLYLCMCYNKALYT